MQTKNKLTMDRLLKAKNDVQVCNKCNTQRQYILPGYYDVFCKYEFDKIVNTKQFKKLKTELNKSKKHIEQFLINADGRRL